MAVCASHLLLPMTLRPMEMEMEMEVGVEMEMEVETSPYGEDRCLSRSA